MCELLQSKFKLAAIVGGSSLVAIAVWKLLKKKDDNCPPKKWRKVGEVSDLLCYPIKSCGWIRISEFDCTIIGVQNDFIRDRTFMVVNMNGEFVTARQYPKLVQVMPDIDQDVMTLSAPGMSDVKFNIADLLLIEPIRAKVWGEDVDAADAGDEVAKWFSRFILQADEGLRLVYYVSSTPTRDVREKNKIFDSAVREDTGALHDATSYMLINEDSIEELNSRIENKVTPLQFRPNLVVKGPAAFEEDQWKWIKIGDEVIFRNVKPCSRCIFTNVDPKSGERNPKEEPLKTLKSYRKFDKTGDSPVMGIHLGVRKQGLIRLDDDVYVEDD